MLVKLNNQVQYINSINDVKDFVDPELFEAIEQITSNIINESIETYEENNLGVEDAEVLKETNVNLQKQLEQKQEEIYKLQDECRTYSSAVYNLKCLFTEYQQSKSKRVDKGNLIDKLKLIMQELKKVY